MAAGVAIGEAAHKERIERRAGDHAELTEFGDGIGQAPVRHAHPHSALNDFGKLHHLWIVSQILMIHYLLLHFSNATGKTSEQYYTDRTELSASSASREARAPTMESRRHLRRRPENR